MSKSAGRGSRSDKEDAERGRETLRDVFRLQQRFVSRTANYLNDVGQLAAAGSLEPREYVERSTMLWADLVGAIGDWLGDSAAEKTPPSTGSRVPREREAPRVPVKIRRKADSSANKLEVLDKLFEGGDEDATFRISIDGFARRARVTGKKSVRRPAAPLQPDTHFSLVPDEITRDGPKAELKLFNLRDNLAKDDEYEGGLWAARVTGTGVEPRRLFCVIELKVDDPE